MGRDRANIKTDLWVDEHWRTLTHDAQWLYKFLLTSPALNNCGVTDWRSVRIAASASDVTAEDVELWAGELEREHFLVIDRATEEVVIRSFFRHDGILAQPNPMKGAAREFGAIASPTIRGVLSHELRRLKKEYPDGVGKANVWEQVPELAKVMKTTPIDARNPSPNPSGNPSVNPSVATGGNPSVNPSDTSTSTSTSTELRSSPKKPELRLPKDWAPTAEHIARAGEAGINVIKEAESFRLHAETHDRHAANWNAAFTTWLKKSKPSGNKPPGAIPEWMMNR